MTIAESLIIDTLNETRKYYAMELTVEELIERLQEVKDSHKKVYIEQNDESLMTPVTGVEKKHYGVIILS